MLLLKPLRYTLLLFLSRYSLQIVPPLKSSLSLLNFIRQYMNYSLNAYQQNLTAAQAAHLLRRATFGPTQAEIASFTNLSATTAILNLINNVNYVPDPPIDLDSTSATAGQEYVTVSYNGNRGGDYRYFYKLWWLNMIMKQGGNPSIVDKLTLFWQNHFVTTQDVVDEYRAIYKYFTLIRNGITENNIQKGGILGNFKDMVYNISKDPAMLKFLNGDQNINGKPNENYARELQELFVIGAKDFAGNDNYTEDDVKAAARVLTGWNYSNFYTSGSTSVGTSFTSTKHDTIDKQFSLNYPDPVNPTLGNVITGRTVAPMGYSTAGDAELDDLLNMLFRHPQSPKFICRKLYRFFVNPNVTQAIEDNVITPLADIFKSQDSVTGRAFEVKPIIIILLASEHFYDVGNIGAVIKSPMEFAAGMLRFFNFPVPVIDSNNLTNSIKAFRSYTSFIYYRMVDMQMNILDQPTVFGYDAYFQTGYSRNWINTTQVGLRNSYTDNILFGYTTISPTGVTPVYKLKIDMLAMVDTTNAAHNSSIPLPPNYDVTNPVHIIDLVTINLFATPLSQTQKDFLIDTILLSLQQRSNWTTQWASYKSNPTSTSINTVKSKLENLMKYLLRMAEYSIC